MTKLKTLWLRLRARSGLSEEAVASRAPASSVIDQVQTPEHKTWPRDYDMIQPIENPEDDLVDLDHSYAGMFRLHAKCHRGLIDEVSKLARPKGRKLLEVAPGTGWNARAFRDAGFEYWGLDISETALAVLLRRFPDARVINCEIGDVGFIADHAFDILYCSSMLEHLEDHEGAIRQLVRVTRSDLYVMFYEGLSIDEPDRFQHFPFDNPQWRRQFGRKSTAYQDRHDGYFMKRFARRTIEDIVKELGVEYEFLDATNRSYLTNETVMHVRK